MLLSQSQVSVVVSSGVVIFFTLLLFLSGYTIQQRTVTSLQQALKPRLPKPPPSLVVNGQQHPLNPDLPSSRFFRKTNGNHIALTDFRGAKHDLSANVDWQRLAHVQLVRSHHDVCNAVMVLADLHRLKSPARRILLFPQAWAAEKPAGKGSPSDPYMDSSRRLMRIAARRYGVELRPVGALARAQSSEDGTGTGTGTGEVYSLASAFALTDLDRVLHLETPGMIIDAAPLDAVLAFTEPAPLAMLHDSNTNTNTNATESDSNNSSSGGVHPEDLLLIQPSGATHLELVSLAASSERGFNDSRLSSAFSDSLLLLDSSSSSSDTSALIRSIGSLQTLPPATPFNQSAFLSDLAYLRFSDAKLPGPEYDVPWTDKVAARPANKDADWIWTKLYGSFQQSRMEICGLDLQTWRP